tara:strand:+ start:722 stop:1018 length:297 start_codon:yes stop_codon:yes gene_type:complete
MHKQHVQHIQMLQNLKNENSKLKNENSKLKEELEFMHKIFNHSSAMVFQMKIFTKKGEKVWINTQQTTLKELEELDISPEVEELIDGIKQVKYNDKLY